MKKSHDIPVHELSEELQNIYYCVGKNPLHKLVPSGHLGFPGYTPYGMFTRNEEDEKHLSVRLGVRYHVGSRQWYCYITVTDADDLIFSYSTAFTVEEWKKSVDLYNSLYMIDTELLHLFH